MSLLDQRALLRETPKRQKDYQQVKCIIQIYVLQIRVTLDGRKHVKKANFRRRINAK
jgi:hypothetical protein